VVYRQVVTTFANKMKQKDATVFFVEDAVMALVMAIIYYFIDRLLIFKFSGLTEPEGVIK
jgi:hypothetical protein